ncbi:MAG: adenosylcobinamide-GDP ribazoletransferase [Desulfobacterales bacterium]|nr:adenosylcobinamide-GDP ribazoletransferase [Desulfobacterales bacterium]MDD4070831.1 adenosylcobinamide-GDP ribazoletransferase [Desulfobacterales bacterium]MDD4391233.1 adenosylcobinamide-GDP ribazoletransferase [Desulfobacterales bacterium]
MNSLISAIQFITILPIGKQVPFNPRAMIPFFPVAGIILGIAVTGFDHIASAFWPAPVTSLLDVIFLIVLTGAFHMDGLGDTADGLYNYRNREKALAIMKDSRIGVMGLVAIVCALLTKWAGIYSIQEHRWLLLLIIPSYARASMIFGIRFLPYGRPEGTGHDFFNTPLPFSAFWALLIPVCLSLFLGWQALWLNFLFIAITGLTLLYYKNRMDCITGDMLGAMSEITESLLFLLISAGGIS